jgi:low affinity Fe/Cu permease
MTGDNHQSKEEEAASGGAATFFDELASRTSQAAGRASTFILAAGIVVVWGISGPLFGFSDTWQLVINTGTTIVTFLMVFLIQNSQNRDSAAIQVKLDELIRVGAAQNSLVGIEHLSDRELEDLRKKCEARAKAEKTGEDTVRASSRTAQRAAQTGRGLDCALEPRSKDILGWFADGLLLPHAHPRPRNDRHPPGPGGGGRAKGEALMRTADRLLCESCNVRMWADGEPIDPSPTIDQAVNGGYSWLQIECARCKAVHLAALRHPPTTFVHDLASRLRCSKCAKAGRRPGATLLQLAPRPRQAAGET